jgi:hypothetical protein
LATVTKPRGADRVRTANLFIQRFYDKDSQVLLKDWNLSLSKQCKQVGYEQLRAGDLLMGGGKKLIPIDTANLDRDT